MAKLTVVIVNYNVKHFLEQCIHSVRRAAADIDTEIIVVDNNSVDGSCAMIKEKFPCVKLIENRKNTGFSKANNQAIKQSSGEYILLLNPDTVVQEDTFNKCLAFMDEHKEAGALGVKMIDGNGHFLPESKRSLPKPSVAFYKIFGLSKVFPKSKIFGKYHLTYLDKDQTNEVEILPGAFMLIRKEALDKAGLLDEEFFMYGEDIDLSYRLIKAGYKNYYFPKTTIIHYKGESTKKSSMNYVLIFYKAMLIFARKHFTQKRVKTFSTLIYFAIYFRASLSLIRRFLNAITVPLIDFLVIYGGYYQLVSFWEQYRYKQHAIVYPNVFYNIILPVYIIIWIIFILFSGGYDKPLKLRRIIRGVLIGTIVILVLYALVPESLHFSRLLIFAGTVWAIVATIFFRSILHLLNIEGYKLGSGNKKRIIIVGDKEEALRINSIIDQIEVKAEITGYVSPQPNKGENGTFIGDIDQLGEIVRINNIDEIIFSAKELSTKSIIKKMLELSDIKVDYKIAPPESLSIIGSNSINTSGELYVINFNSIAKPMNKRNKRIFDMLTSFILIICYPVLIFFVKKPGRYLTNCLKVLAGLKTWVGFYIDPNLNNGKLPSLKKGIFTPLDGLKKTGISTDMIEKINLLYSKDYKLENDLSIVFKNVLYIGNK
jgi:GT2 family glycosyltransferase